MPNLSIDWKKWYKDHLTTNEKVAAECFKDGDHWWLGQCNQVPYELLDELYKNMEKYHDIFMMYNCMCQPADIMFDKESKKHFRMNSMFCVPLERMSGEMGIMEFSGANYDQLDQAPFAYGIDKMAIHVCPPDENGWCNCGGYGVSVVKAIVARPEMKLRVAYLDKTGQYPMPGPLETTSLHITDFDYIVEAPTDMIAVPSAPPQEIDKQIASFILPYICEGDKLQIGFGGLGEEILANLRDIGHFEIFSEVACDTMAELCSEGVITKITACSPGACSEEFFRFCSESGKAQLVGTEVALNPFIIAQQDNLCCINAAFMCDLIGQVCAEAQGLQVYSGTGGSFAYVYGATRAKNGRSFICIRSTYKDHDGVRHSNIVPWLPEGSIVTTLKNFVMFLVTEWGVADVFCRTLKDRIRAIIQIAHPEFRQELKAQICTTPLIDEEDFGDLDIMKLQEPKKRS
ncbi:MAG: hypothetical protein EOM14_05205 [Clostridia bacterium]|nr:hypothetical protein [Clostridia bacterium]